MTETPFFFSGDVASLFGVMHDPTTASRLPFVFCHPFAEEKLWTHRVFVSFARALATLGHPVLRFDYMGNGDSDGSFEQSSLTNIRADVACAIEELRRRTGAARVGLLGLRLGASIAALVTDARTDVERLILWAPIVDGGRYMQELLRVNLTTQMATFKQIREDRDALIAAMAQGRTVNVDGYEVAHRLYSEVSAVKLAGAIKTFTGPCLVVHIDRQPELTSSEATALASCYPNGLLENAQEDPFWKEIPRFYQEAPNLFATTLQWLARDLSPLSVAGADA